MTSETINIEIPIIPKAQMRARHFAKQLSNGKVFTGTHKAAEQQRYEDQLMALLAKYKPESPLTGWISVKITCYLPVPQSWPQWKYEAAINGYIKPTGKPDIDNLTKNIVDCMTKLSYWRDDSNITKCDADKEYAVSPRWELVVSNHIEPKTKKEYEITKADFEITNQGSEAV